MASYGYTFNSGDGVTPTRLNAARTVSDIVNADIASAAAIDKTKISGTAITAADTGTVTSAMIADGTIVNADISASAAIAGTKISPNFGSQNIATTGQVSAGGNFVTAITGFGGLSMTSNATSGNTEIIGRRSRGTPASPTVVQSGDSLITIAGQGYDGSSYANAAFITMAVGAATGSGDMPGLITFSTTADGASTPTERMRITAAGNIGINKNNPATALDVTGTVTATGFSGPLVGDVTGTASAIADNTVTNAKVAAGAAIAHNKLASITAGHVLLGNASNVVTATALAGDVTVSSLGTTAISAGAIVDADINASAAIALSKLATGALPSAITVASANIVNGTIVNADISTSAGITDEKLATISSTGKVANSATTANSANLANSIVARNSAGGFEAETITGAKFVPTGSSATGNGMYLPAANTIGFSTDGFERTRLDNSGVWRFHYTGGELMNGNTTVSGVAIHLGTVHCSRGDVTPLSLNKLTSNGSVADFYRGGVGVGSISVTATATAYNTSSDYRLKDNPQPMVGALSRLSQVNPVTFTWKSNGSQGEGFIAHELQAVVPEAVTGEKDAVDAEGNPQYQGVDASKLVPILVAAVQELSAKVAALEAAQ